MIQQEYTTSLNGISIPKLIYGTAWKKELTSKLVLKALQNGFKGIDTACQPKHYNEIGVGDAIDSANIRREDLFIQTKFTPINGQDPTKIPYDHNASLEDQVYQSFATSKRNLKVNFLDSLILHSPLDTLNNTLEVWKAMEKIYNDGGAKILGISNCYELKILKQLYENAEIKPMVVQNRFYRQTNYDRDLRSWINEKGIIYQSFWSLTANPDILMDPALEKIASSTKKTAPQVFFRFLTQNNIVPLTGTTSEKHMQEDLSIFDFELSSHQIEKISSLL